MNNKFINILSEKDNKINLNDNITKEYLLMLEYNKVYNDLYNSFKNLDARFTQFNKDFIRSNIYINNNRIVDFKTFITKFNNNSLDKISLICTQATFAYPYMLLVNSVQDKKLYIGELSKNDKTEIINSKLKIFITKKNKEVSKIILKKYLRAFYINKNGYDRTHKIIYIKIIFNINTNEIYLKLKIK